MNSSKTFHVVMFSIPNNKSIPEARRGSVRFAETHPEWELTILQPTASGAVTRELVDADGVLVCTWPKQTPRLLQATKKPVVFIDPPDHMTTAPNRCEHFVPDHKIGTIAAQHLLTTCRCRSFAFAATLETRSLWPIFVRERSRGFREALVKNRFSCQTLVGGNEAEVLTTLTRPIGVFAATDERGIEVMILARKLGLRIPDDLMVLGVDNDELICKHINPKLSSIEVDFADSAYRACMSLDALMHGRRPPPHVVANDVNVHVVMRQSTSFPDKPSRIVSRALNLVHDRAARGLTVQEVARSLGVSRQLLSLRMREATSTTLQELISQSRFKHAITLLRQTSQPLKSIADECGFKNLSHFMTSFRRRYGETPTSYRRKARDFVCGK